MWNRKGWNTEDEARSKELPPENLDNHLSAINKAKDDLFKINEEIKSAIKQREEISAFNHSLLKEKLEEISRQRKELDGLLSEAKELKSNNLITAKCLEEANEKLRLNEKEVLDFKNSNFKKLKDKESEILNREQEISKLSVELDTKKAILQSETLKNADILEKIQKENKELKEFLNKILAEKQSNQEFLLEISKKLEEEKEVIFHLESLKQESDKKLLDAQNFLEESRRNKRQSEENLSSVLKEKQYMSDLIIENKRVKMESIKSIEAAQRNIVEANLKIAELKELKEAMAKS